MSLRRAYTGPIEIMLISSPLLVELESLVDVEIFYSCVEHLYPAAYVLRVQQKQTPHGCAYRHNMEMTIRKMSLFQSYSFLIPR